MIQDDQADLRVLYHGAIFSLVSQIFTLLPLPTIQVNHGTNVRCRSHRFDTMNNTYL